MKEFLTANGRGWGVAAAEVIKKGAYIVEYAGANRRMPCQFTPPLLGTGSSLSSSMPCS